MKCLKKIILLALTVAMGTAGSLPVYAEEAGTPQVLIYRDYEDYTGGSNVLNTGGIHGNFATDATGAAYNNSTATEGEDGTAVKIASNTGANANPFFSNNGFDSGRIYVAFDEIPNYAEGTNPADRAFSFNLYNSDNSDICLVLAGNRVISGLHQTAHTRILKPLK